MSASAVSKCRSCGGTGVGLTGASGLCGHCERKSGGHPAEQARAGVGAGVKRKHNDISETVEPFTGPLPTGRELTAEELEALLSSASSVPSLDANGVKRLVLSLEKAITRNQLARAKHAGEPARFMESEVELHGELQQMKGLAAAPAFYPILLKSECLKSILSLLAHENTDIANAVVSLLAELTDVEEGGEEEDEEEDAEEADNKANVTKAAARELVQAIVEEGGLELLISNLNRLKDSESSEDKDGAYASLSVIENFIDVEPAVASRLCDTKKSDTSLVPFLLERLSSRTFDDTKLYASELLAILLQTDPEKHGAALGSSTFPIAARGGGTRLVDGIEYLCECINMYKKHSPELPEEQECLQNLFSCLCTLLTVAENQTRFRAIEGFELMLRLVQAAGFARLGALHVLSFAVARVAHNCEVFVEVGGLKELFPSLMGKGESHTRKVHGGIEAVYEEQAYAVTTLAHCLQWLPRPHPAASLKSVASEGFGSGVHLIRVLSKFRENAHEKIDRLIELFQQYSARVSKAAAEQEEEFDEEGLADDMLAKLQEYREDLNYKARMDAGMRTLQKLAVCISCAYTCVAHAQAAAKDTGIVVEPSQLSFLEDISFTARSKLYEQGISVLQLLDIVTENLAREERTGSSTSAQSPEVASLSQLVELLQGASGLTTAEEGSMPAPAARNPSAMDTSDS